MARLFGTDGVRGIANAELTAELAFHLGVAAVSVLSDQPDGPRRVIIGKDTRISGDMLEAALISGFTAVGADVDLAGVIPTPGIAYLTRQHAYDIGVVISASHNSYEFNGIKFFSKTGYKLPDEVEDRIEEKIRHYTPADITARGAELGRCREIPEAADEYREALRSLCGCDLSGLRIAIDCANGASSAIAPRLFAELGAELLIIGAEPDGININRDCGSTHPEALAQLVLEQGCDLGLAFDGDADRLMAVDDRGAVLDGDHMLSIMACDLKARGELDHESLVVTVMSNLGLDRMAEQQGIELRKTKVGDRYVLEEMLRGGYCLGGEQSGHMIFLRESSTGDGMLSALHLLRALKKSGEKLSELRRIMHSYPQVLINAQVSNTKKSAAMKDEGVQELAQSIEARLEKRGRLLLRPSGTEPYIRVMLEGEEEAEIAAMARELADLIEARFGA